MTHRHLHICVVLVTACSLLSGKLLKLTQQFCLSVCVFNGDIPNFDVQFCNFCSVESLHNILHVVDQWFALLAVISVMFYVEFFFSLYTLKKLSYSMYQCTGTLRRTLYFKQMGLYLGIAAHSHTITTMTGWGLLMVELALLAYIPASKRGWTPSKESLCSVRSRWDEIF